MFVIHSMGGGGAERVTANLANYWAGKGWKITILTLTPSSFDFYELHPAVRRICLNLAGDSPNIMIGLWQNLRRVAAVRHMLRKIQPDIALGVMTNANVILAMAGFGLRIGIVGSEHVHAPQYPLSPLWESLRRCAYGRLDAVTALTRESARWFESHTGARRVTVIPNAAPWPLFEQEPKVSPESVCQSKRHVLLAVGRLEVQKGFDWLLDAFSGLVQKHPDWDLVILGEGSLRTTIERQVEAARLEGRVFLPGRVGNVSEWYERADLYVMSSRFEGFGNTLAEALTYGVPAVSFNCESGPGDIIRHEIDGLLVAPGEVDSLAATLDRLMGDTDLRQRFSVRATDARERFSLERIAGMWEDLFEKVIK